jgi:hypothetical protein
VARNFGLVDDKVAEAEFFVEKLSSAGFNFFEARCYFSAFVSAARSITFCLQAVMNEIPGFTNWYAQKQGLLKQDPGANYFSMVRTENQKIGRMPLAAGTSHIEADGRRCVEYYFLNGIGERLPEAPHMDVLAASRAYLKLLVEVVFDCYKVFGPTIDPDQYYRLENLRSLGISLEDVEESLGLPRGWTAQEGASEADRLTALRSQVSFSGIDPIFEKYLGVDRLREIRRDP